jgi:hypothetical protein
VANFFKVKFFFYFFTTPAEVIPEFLFIKRKPLITYELNNESILLYLSRLSSYLNINFGTRLICINFDSLERTIDENFSRDFFSGD